MFAVVGLGNPGARYAETRHSTGFEVVKCLAQRWAAVGSPGGWKSKFGCDYARVQWESREGLLVLPQQYMNLSGEACVPLLRFFKVGVEEIVVVHDDLDLEPGVLRCKKGGSAGGHKGVGDIILHLGAEDFYRVRVGIGHPRGPGEQRETEAGDEVNNERFWGDSCGSGPDVTSWVLSRPGPKEKELLEKAVSDAAEAVEVLLEQGLRAAQNRFHQRQRE